MAKSKKIESPAIAAKKSKVKQQKKPAVKIPQRKNPSTRVMVTHALTTLKSRQGCSLAAIRNCIKEKYNVELNKQRQNLIKNFMTEEFNAGRIKMTNNDKLKIDFSKRFNIKN